MEPDDFNELLVGIKDHVRKKILIEYELLYYNYLEAQSLSEHLTSRIEENDSE